MVKKCVKRLAYLGMSLLIILLSLLITGENVIAEEMNNKGEDYRFLIFQYYDYINSGESEKVIWLYSNESKLDVKEFFSNADNKKVEKEYLVFRM